MRYLSVCSGIEAATVAWHPLGWSPVAFAEIEAFSSAVLQHHYPSVPNWGDMTKFQEWPHAAIDILVGGTPCQSFSVAGLRKGLADPRGNLTLTYLAIADKYRPEWVVWENVPGVLSSAGGRDFGAFLGGLGQLGYGWAYRILDAQYFGLAQRRRRVFVVGCLGGWQRAAAVLFERHSLSGHPAPRRETGQRPAPSLAPRAQGSGGLGIDAECDGALIASTGDIAHYLNGGGMGRQDYETETMVAHALRADGFDASKDGTGRGTALMPVCATLGAEFSRNRGLGNANETDTLVCHAFDARQSDVIEYGDMTGPLDTDGHSVAVAIQGTLIARTESRQGGLGVSDDGMMHTLTKTDVHGIALLGGIDHENNGHTADEPTGPLMKGSPTGGGRPLPAVAVAFEPGSIAHNAGPSGESDLAPTLRSDMGDNQPAVRMGMAVRRLTPRECERLQGFADDYTLISYRGKPAADGPRYRALGNSMAVPVMRWIGQRLQAVQEMSEQGRTA